MCTMIRPKGKAEKIAHSILGKPANILEFKKGKRSNKEQRLLYENTTLMR